jgi:hypothetical protein
MKARWALVALEVLIAVNAVYGGVGLMVNGMGMPGEWLERTPFDSWVVPGVLLLALVAAPMRWRSPPRWAGRGGPTRRPRRSPGGCTAAVGSWLGWIGSPPAGRNSTQAKIATH